MSYRSLSTLLVFAAGCGRLANPADPVLNIPTVAAPAQNVAIIYQPVDPDTPISGDFNHMSFAPASAVYVTAINADGRTELQMAFSSVANYCDLLSAGADQDGDVVARLRLVTVAPSGTSINPGPGTYTESMGPTWAGAVRDIPPPAATAPGSAPAVLAPGNYLSAGYVSIRNSCNVLQLNPAFVGSSMIVRAMSASTLTGAVDLVFADGVGQTVGFALSGNFTAVLCPALAAGVGATPFTTYNPPLHCYP